MSGLKGAVAKSKRERLRTMFCVELQGVWTAPRKQTVKPSLLVGIMAGKLLKR